MEDLTDHQNPFASPAATSDDAPPNHPDYQLPLAGRLTRLGAQIVDGVVMTILNLPVSYFVYGDMWRTLIDPTLNPLERQQAIEALQPGIGVSILTFLAGMTAYLLVNGYWLAKDGQTLGKKVAGIKIVRTDGRQATLARLFGVRTLPFWLIGMIRNIGGLLVLIDILFIFRGSRRCLHDQVADTIVIQAG